MGWRGTQLAGDYPSVLHRNVAAFAQRSWTSLPKFLASPLNAPSVEAFDDAAAWVTERFDNEQPIVLDSGCGAGLSTYNLACTFPDAAVIGVDRSESRVDKGEALDLPDNALIIRAELATFWRLMLEAEHGDNPVRSALAASRVSKHYVLYPNPYPKSSRLNLRWHGHAAFPALLAIGDDLEVRSNWRVYLDEFRLAASVATDAAVSSDPPTADTGLPSHRARALEWTHGRVAMRSGCEVQPLHLDDAGEAMTAFERKFYEVREPLWRLRSSMAQGG